MWIAFFAIFFTNGGAKGEIDSETLNKANLSSTQMAFEKDLVSLKKQHFWSFNRTFTNYVGGYSVKIPNSLQFLDFDSYDERAVFGNENVRLEIYNQHIEKEMESYLNYSNVFLENKQDHQLLDAQDFTKENGYSLHFKEWQRPSLKRIKNDRPYYFCADLVKKDQVYTFFISADNREILEKINSKLVDSFQDFKPSKKAQIFRNNTRLRKNLNDETKAIYKKYFSPESKLIWGFFPSNIAANGFQDFTPFHHLEKELGSPHFPILVDYMGIKEKYKTDEIFKRLQNCYQEGRIVELTLQPKLYDMTKEPNRIYDILNGKYDKGLRSFAKQVATFGHPVLFRPLNEMNGAWCSYSALWASRDPQVYVELYRYLYRIFEEEGALANTLWIWNPNEKSFPGFAWNKASSYYPGDEYVDLVGLTGYNTGDYYEGETWRSFKEIYTPIYQDMSARYQQPFLITEFSCSKFGGNKAQWVRDMLKEIEDFPRIKVAIWWHGCDYDKDGNIARSYFIDDNPDTVPIFRQYFLENGNA